MSCYSCSAETDIKDSLCKDCEKKGYWIDPAGGLHTSDDPDYDPLAMYE